MKYLFLIRKTPIPEVLIIFVYVLIVNSCLGNVDERIKADGIGYYDYLPSIFIHHDLVRKDFPYESDFCLYDRIKDMGVYVNYGEFKVNKHPCGTAILQLPFFLYSRFIKNSEIETITGYERHFHITIFHASIFYLWLSLIFLKKILTLYRIKWGVIILIQLLLVLATPITNYVNFDPSFSHIYSLFAITGFIYFVKAFFNHRNFKDFLSACLFLGLIIIIRQINVLIIFFIPFLADSLADLRTGIRHIWNRPIQLIMGFLIVIGIFSIQIFYGIYK